jgi:hypothetical protein
LPLGFFTTFLAGATADFVLPAIDRAGFSDETAAFGVFAGILADTGFSTVLAFFGITFLVCLHAYASAC